MLVKKAGGEPQKRKSTSLSNRVPPRHEASPETTKSGKGKHPEHEVGGGRAGNESTVKSILSVDSGGWGTFTLGQRRFRPGLFEPGKEDVSNKSKNTSVPTRGKRERKGKQAPTGFQKSGGKKKEKKKGVELNAKTKENGGR